MRFGWDKIYSHLYEIVHPSPRLISLYFLTGVECGKSSGPSVEIARKWVGVVSR